MRRGTVVVAVALSSIALTAIALLAGCAGPDPAHVAKASAASPVDAARPADAARAEAARPASDEFADRLAGAAGGRPGESDDIQPSKGAYF